MWNLMNNINKQNINRLINAESKFRAVRGERSWGLGETSEGIKQQKQNQKNLIDTDNSMVITRGKG